MSARPDSPAAIVGRFIECINRGDVDGLGRLMTDGHELRIFDEAPVRGREANVAAWQGYASSFPAYRIVPRAVAEDGATVAVLGHTTGSHLGLPDDEESKLTLIWVAAVEGDRLRFWELIDDGAENRARFGLGGEG